MFRKFKFGSCDISSRHKNNLLLSYCNKGGDLDMYSAISMNKSLPSLNNLHMPQSRRSMVPGYLPQNGGLEPPSYDDTVDETPRKIDQSVRSESEHDKKENSIMDDTVHLLIHLPGGKSVQLDVDARMPMMDVLIQAATCNGIQPSGLCLKEADVDKKPAARNLLYKPSTPVGKLPCREFYLVRKEPEQINGVVALKNMSRKTSNLPFEPTVRISIDLPHNQKTFLRINPEATLKEVLLKVCQQHQIIHSHNEQLILSLYTLRICRHRDNVLDLSMTLQEVGFMEFVLIPKKSENRRLHTDVINSYSQMVFEQKQYECKNRGLFGLFRRKDKKARKSLGSITNLSQSCTFNDTYGSRKIDTSSCSEYAQSNASYRKPKLVSKSVSVDDSTFAYEQSLVNGCVNLSSKKPPMPPANSGKKRPAPKPPTATSAPLANDDSPADGDQSPAAAAGRPQAPVKRTLVSRRQAPVGQSQAPPVDHSQAAPVSRPQAAVDQSQASVDQYQKPASQPQAAIDQSQASVNRSQASVDQSQKPVSQPQAAVDQSQASVNRSQASVDQSQKPAGRPQAAIDQSQAPVDKPQAPIVQPQASIVTNGGVVLRSKSTLPLSSFAKNSADHEQPTTVRARRAHQDSDLNNNDKSGGPIDPLICKYDAMIEASDKSLSGGDDHVPLDSVHGSGVSGESCSNRRKSRAPPAPPIRQDSLAGQRHSSPVNPTSSTSNATTSTTSESCSQPAAVVVVAPAHAPSQQATSNKRGPKPPLPPPLSKNLLASTKSTNVVEEGSSASNENDRPKHCVQHSQSVPGAKITADEPECKDDLMRAIRDFGGTGGLRKTSGLSRNQFFVKTYVEPRH